ncbi:glycerophosphodiester phosphodiesterase GDPDL4-like [Zingiber officinale]|nr:glycerophosphodiester phosphodiesterase GDPDL4-like [Zingiber officinale]
MPAACGCELQLVRKMGSRSSSAAGRRATSSLVGFLILQWLGLACAQKSSAWLTLSGNAPAIIAKGGFSGLFPDSSINAYSFVNASSSKDTILWCDVRLTKDGVGICLPDLKLDNCTDITYYYPNRRRTYWVNGVKTVGWFSVDYNFTDLAQVSLTQAIYSRTPNFDFQGSILIVPDLRRIKPFGIWLNIQHDIFYRQHNLSMRSYVLSVTKQVVVNYLSSPELLFLSGIEHRFRNTTTKLIFRFLAEGIREPSTNLTYASLLTNLTYIKTFASGILVPKSYIWPVTDDNYLSPYTPIVADAHSAGLEIYASDFANDNLFSYNYSYDPLAEYLSFIDNGFFSVDGVVSDYPITPSEAVGCFSHLNTNSQDHGKPLIISHNGASGEYADCTDMAYQKAVDDGADVIDCSVQLTKDEVLVCMSNVDLLTITTVTSSPYSSQHSLIPEIKSSAGIFTFNLTWDEIKNNLKPLISQPESVYRLKRNPRYRNSGMFMRLSDFLEFALDKNLFGVLISIEHAKFMAERLRFDVVESVISALNYAGYDNTSLQVMIQSPNSSVLEMFKQLTQYKLVYKIDYTIRDADPSSVSDIKTFAHAVALSQDSIYPELNLYITGETGLIPKFHAAGLDVYVYLFQNEFLSQPWDFLSDATVMINTYSVGAGVDGIITDFPGTGRRYKRNTCRNLSETPNYMLPIQGGLLVSLMYPGVMPPAMAPMPVLSNSNVTEPPLPTPTTVAPSQHGGMAPSLQPSGCQCVALAYIQLVFICGFYLLL